MVSRRDWSLVPSEILELIIERLTCIEDYVRFGGVCQSWRSVVVNRRRPAFLLEALPWLLLPQKEDKPLARSAPVKKIHRLHLPEVHDCDCWGSPYGWLVVKDGKEMKCFNPLSKAFVALPLLSSIENYDHSYSVRKVVLSSPSSSPVSIKVDQFVAMIIFSGARDLAFARPGDRVWTTIKTPVDSVSEDILQMNNDLYVVGTDGIVMHSDTANPIKEAHHFASPPYLHIDDHRFYLLEFLSELHMVVRFFRFKPICLEYYHVEHARPFEDHHDARTTSFEVFKLDLVTKRWRKIYSLGDYAFFLGNNSSFSVRVSDRPGFKSNCIYFTDDYDHESMTYDQGYCSDQGLKSRGLDMGIFSLRTRNMEPFYTSDEVVSFSSLPVWITPNLS
ncbi:hypothetical protein ACHQM5_003308 [Ranunculus cassubicifolius]